VLPFWSDNWGRGDGWRIFSPCFSWSYGPSLTSWSSGVASPDGWLVSSIWFLPSTGQVAIGTCGSSLPVCTKWTYLLLFLPGSSYVALQLQLWLVSFSLSKVGQFSFVLCPQSHEFSSVFCHTPALPYPAPTVWEFGFLPYLPHPIPRGWFSILPSPLSGRLQFTIYVCQFCFGGVQSACVLHWIMSRGQACSAWCSPAEFADLHRQL
jgi:hypothetical protein